MSKRTDRGMQSDRLLLGVLIVLAALVASGGIMLWMRKSSNDTAQKPVLPDQQLAHQLFLRDESLPITFYYPHEGMLAAGSIMVKRQPDTQSLAREALVVLFADQRASPAPVLRDIRLRGFYLDASGTSYIDLTSGPRKELRASAWEEQLAIYALVNTLLQNFEEIKQVEFLLDGGDAQTLAGHMDLSRSFTKRMDLVKQ
jgi:hypothetical protein